MMGLTISRLSGAKRCLEIGGQCLQTYKLYLSKWRFGASRCLLKSTINTQTKAQPSCLNGKKGTKSGLILYWQTVITSSQELVPTEDNPIYFGEDALSTFQGKIRANADAIFQDLRTWYGIIPYIEGSAFSGIPRVLDWLFDDSQQQSVAEIARLETELHQHHSCSLEKKENSINTTVPSQQCSLTQQLLERHPLVYLLYVLLQQDEEKSMFLVAYPTPAISSPCAADGSYRFQCNPLGDEYRPLRAMVPMMAETSLNTKVVRGVITNSTYAKIVKRPISNGVIRF